MRKICWLFVFFLTIQFSGFAQSLAEARVQLDNENYGAARKILREIIAKEADNAEAYYYLGESYYMDDKSDSAKLSYEKGLDVNAKNASCQAGIGKLLLDKKKTDEARKALDLALRLGKSNKEARINSIVGMVYLESQNPNPEEAVKYLTAARDLDTRNPKYFIELGDAYLAKNDPGNAMTNYEFASDKDKDNPEVYMKMARIWAKTTLTDQAIKKLEECIKIAPEYAPAYKDLIELYNRERRYDDMTKLLERYVQLAGTDLEARARFVRFLCFQAKDYDRTIIEANKLLKEDPTNYTMYRWLAWANYEKGNYQESLDASKKFFAQVGDGKVYGSDYEYLAKSAQKLNDLDMAATNYHKVVEMDERRIDVYDLIAKMYYDAKKYKEAGNGYEEKINKGKSNPQDFFFLGMSRFFSTDYAKADSAFGKLTELLPSYPAGFYWKARSMAQLEPDSAKTFAARPFYEKYLSLVTVDEKYKTDANLKKKIIESYNYIASNFYEQNDLPNTKAIFEKILAVDPENADAKDNIVKIDEFLKGNK